MRSIKELESAVGGLSTPSKMPGLSYGIPAKDCAVGSLLRAAGKHTVCGNCYAHKGMYVFPNVKDALQRRLNILRRNLSQWQTDMVELLCLKYRNKTGDDRVFRWHDSGDIQGMPHLEAIVAIARSLPTIRFWLPTKEYAIIRGWVHRNGRFPRNLAVRVSAPIVGQAMVPIQYTVSSTVGRGRGFQCPAYTQGGQCLDCRECWSKSRRTVDYPQH
jgi:hypothetical protein